MKHILILVSISLFSLVQLTNAQNDAKKGIKKISTYETDYELGTSKAILEREVTYDAKGNILEEKDYKNGKVKNHFSYSYDIDNNKIEQIEYDENGKQKKIFKYIYKNNLKVERISLDGKGHVKAKKTYQYEMY